MSPRRTKSKKPPPDYHFTRRNRTWKRKFSDAFSGLFQAIHQQSSYSVHFVAAMAVLGSAWLLGNFDLVRWTILVLCIFTVIGAEMFNTALETLARAITTSYNPLIGKALNIASGAVLTVACGAAVAGTLLFAESLLKWGGYL